MQDLTLYPVNWQLEILFYKIILLSVIRSPVQVVPSPVNPFLHVQLYEPTKFSHVAFVSQDLEIHSSMSEKIKHKYQVIIEYIRKSSQMQASVYEINIANNFYTMTWLLIAFSLVVNRYLLKDTQTEGIKSTSDHVSRLFFYIPMPFQILE